jgi:presenilin enhancer 2
MDPAEDDNLPTNQRVAITKKMFIGGFLFLPWLWLCNVLFHREYMNKPSDPPIVRLCKIVVHNL